VDLQSARALATQVASGNYSVIGGGLSNTASSWYATVGGGWSNTASGFYATVGGGLSNTASNQYATVGGGYFNTASGSVATVGGGISNTASGYIATVGGGYQNTASGNYSVVPGGYSNTANGAYNLVFGENVVPSVNETHRVYFFGNGTAPSGASGFLVINRLDGDHPIHVGTNNTNGNGAYLTTGGTWTNTSSRSVKERFVQYHPAEVLEKIRQLPVEGYFYKGTEEYHITPMAEDFYRLFGTGVHEIIETDSTGHLVRRPNPDVDKYLAASDVAGVALLGVQALAERVDMLQPQSSALAQRLEALEQGNKQIKEENRHLQQRVEVLQQQNGRLQQQLEQVMKRLALLEAQLSNLAESQK
jgi:FtsZ-binding cell division protein ZapB